MQYSKAQLRKILIMLPYGGQSKAARRTGIAVNTINAFLHGRRELKRDADKVIGELINIINEANLNSDSYKEKVFDNILKNIPGRKRLPYGSIKEISERTGLNTSVICRFVNGKTSSLRVKRLLTPILNEYLS